MEQTENIFLDEFFRIRLGHFLPKLPELPKIERFEVFLGKVSRECKNCGDVKLYKDFNNSHDREVFCNYCTWEIAETEMLKAMTDRERFELLEMEEDIFENEMSYDEALERQEMIDDCLRGLDE